MRDVSNPQVARVTLFFSCAHRNRREAEKKQLLKRQLRLQWNSQNMQGNSDCRCMRTLAHCDYFIDNPFDDDLRERENESVTLCVRVYV